MLLSTLCAVGLLAGAFAGPASADHYVSSWHTNGYWWSGVVQNDCDAFWVLDRSGDPTIHAALREFVNAFNADTARRGTQCWVPYLDIIQDDASIGGCIRGVWNYVGWSFATLCSNGNTGGSEAWYALGRHLSDTQPNIFIERAYPDYNTTFSHIAHELGHAMGLVNGPCQPADHSHSCDPAAIMYGYGLPQGVKRYYTEHDFSAMSFYLSHRGCCI